MYHQSEKKGLGWKLEVPYLHNNFILSFSIYSVNHNGMVQAIWQISSFP